jgi:hypothetical protein
MHFQFEGTLPAPQAGAGEPPPATLAETADLLRQLLEVQREQLSLLRASAAAQDSMSRWKAFLARWQSDFPGVPAGCREALPALERAYLAMIADLTEQLRDRGTDALDNDFALTEFLDRYGMRLGQLGTILTLVGPLADAAQ